MSVIEVYKLMKRHAKCPNCGCSIVGNGKGGIEVDTEKGYFKRTCACGWGVTINEKIEDSSRQNHIMNICLKLK